MAPSISSGVTTRTIFLVDIERRHSKSTDDVILFGHGLQRKATVEDTCQGLVDEILVKLLLPAEFLSFDLPDIYLWILWTKLNGI